MAQTIQIPVSFEFVRLKVDWAEAQAHITGWSRRDDGAADSDNLSAEVNTAGTRKLIELPIGELPEELLQRCLDAFSDGDDDEQVESICSTFEPHLLVPSRGSQHYPRLRGQNVNRLRETGLIENIRPSNAWEMRADFLRITDDMAGALTFLNKWGCWSYRKYIKLSELTGLKKAVREALISPPEKWFASQFAYVSFWQRSATYPFFALHTDMCESAIRMTVTVDLLHKVKHRICARRDCGAPFAISSRHKRKYCSQYCGHLESVRRNRKPKSARNRFQEGN